MVPGRAWLLIHRLSRLLIRCVCTCEVPSPWEKRGEGVGDREPGEMWARGDVTVSEPARGWGPVKASGKLGAQARMPEGRPSWRQVKCKEEGAGGQRVTAGWDVFTEGGQEH